MKMQRLQKFTMLTLLAIIFITAGQESILASNTQEFEPLVIIKSHNALQALKTDDKVNITIDIFNDSESDLYNVSFTDFFNNDTFRVVKTLASIENTSITYDFTENTSVSYTWDHFEPGKRVNFWIELKVERTDPIPSYSIHETTITFENELGIKISQQSNNLNIQISGEIIDDVDLPDRIYNIELVLVPIVYLLPIVLLISFNFLLTKKK